MNKDIINTKKDKYLSLQLVATIGFILALLTSYLLTLDKKLSIEHKTRIFTNKDAQNLALFQTLLVLFVAGTFLYINYNQYKISKEEKQNETDFLLQIETSILAIIGAIIGIYIVSKNYNSNLSISETENL